MADRVGHQLGNYRLVRLIGQGGFAEVYLGEHLYLKRQAALKVLRTTLQEEEVDQFLAEAQILASLTHEHIVRVQDFAVEQGTPFLVMDYAPRGTIRHLHPPGSCLSLETTVVYVKQVAAALQYAHNRNVIHRDVKPENLLLAAEQHLMLSDFGLALLAPSPDLLSTQEMAGTVAYMAPEQLRGKPCFASDQYALATLTYEWLCGVRPFEGTRWEIMYQHASVPPPRLREKDPSLPEAVEGVVLKALAKDPSHRYVSVQLFAQALEHASRAQAPVLSEDSQRTGSLHPLSPAPSAASPHVFLSACPADEALKARLARDLQAQGMIVYQAHAESTPGKPPGGEATRQAIRAAEVVLLLASPQARSSHLVKEHLRIASMYRRRLVCAWVAGRDVAEALPAVEELVPVIDAREGHYEQALEEIMTCLQGARSAPAEPVLPEPMGEPRNPYKGLRAFTQEDAADFFGRDMLIEELVNKVREVLAPEQPGGPTVRLLAVIGPITAMTEPRGPIVVLLTLRADFYERLMTYPELGRLIQHSQTLVWPMEIDDLRAVIRGPAALPDVQLAFEGNLVGDLLFEVREQIGALPLLQFTLEQLFERRKEHLLTLQAYRQIGGVKGALTKQAESTYLVLPSQEHRQLARTLFLRLVSPGTTEQDTTRRRAAHSEFERADSVQAQRMQETLERFISVRLLTTNQVDGTTTIEVSHEALIREWKRLTEWLREARNDILFQNSLSEDVVEWEQRKRPKDRLYRGAQLKEAQAWARRSRPSEQEVAFLRASAERRTLTRMGIIVVILLLLTSTSGAGWFALTRPPDPKLVTTLQDNVNGSLRYCIANAPSGSRITFAQSLRGSIKLIGSLALVSGKRLTILGPGADHITISSGALDSNMHVSKDATLDISGLSFKDNQTMGKAFLFNEGTLTVTDSIISGNKTTSGRISYGGGIENRGRLTVKSSIISNNSASSEGIGEGGGIFNTGTLTVTNSTLSGNTAVGSDSGGYGGGIFNYDQGSLRVINSILSGNTAGSGSSSYGQGGGIQNNGTLTVTNSTLSNNSASDKGGGIFNYQNGTLMVTGSTISNNSANGKQDRPGGGGILSEGTLTLINSTVSGNSAFTDGGGILVQSIISDQERFIAQADLTFSTIYGNRASSGADIAVEDFTRSSNGNLTSTQQHSQMKIRNSIVVGDPAHPGPNISGVLTSHGYNLIQNAPEVVLTPNKQHLTDVLVDPYADLGIDPLLRDNGGPTWTLALLPGSPAIDKIPLAMCHPDGISTDQRGVRRPDANEHFCDIGAYEYTG